ncbi:hypothetical protein ACJX0J_022739, partial [Zea mays]
MFRRYACINHGPTETSDWFSLRTLEQIGVNRFNSICFRVVWGEAAGGGGEFQGTRSCSSTTATRTRN